MRNLEIIDCVGKGDKYFVGHDRKTKGNVFIKKYKIPGSRGDSSYELKSRLSDTKGTEIRLFENELRILKIINGLSCEEFFPHLEKIYRPSLPLDNHEEYYLVFDRGDCTLDELILQRNLSNTPYKENELLTILSNIVACLSSLEEEGISHGNVRIENIIYIYETGLYSLINFEDSVDSTQALANSVSNQNSRMNAFSSSRHSERGPDPYKSDIWSLGLLMLETMGEKVNRVKINQSLIKSRFIDYVSKKSREKFPKVCKLLEMVLDEDPEKRVNLKRLRVEISELFVDQKLDNNFDEDFADDIRKRRLQAFAKRTSNYEDRELFIVSQRVLRREAKKAEELEKCVTISENIVARIGEKEKDIFYAKELLNLSEFSYFFLN